MRGALTCNGILEKWGDRQPLHLVTRAVAALPARERRLPCLPTAFPQDLIKAVALAQSPSWKLKASERFQVLDGSDDAAFAARRGRGR